MSLGTSASEEWYRSGLLRTIGRSVDLVDIRAPSGGYLMEMAPSRGPSSDHGLRPWR